jgi:hypothetical protein
VNFGDIICLKKPIEKEFVTFEVGDELFVANYIHKSYVLLKHPRVRDLQKIKYTEIDETCEVVGHLVDTRQSP